MLDRFLNDRVTLHCGDCRDVLATLEECSLDSCVTDPPYLLTSIVNRFGADGAAPARHGSDGLFRRLSGGFMGQRWDAPGESHGLSVFEAWLAGFIAGEGCFRIQAHKNNRYYTCQFSIHLRQDDTPILMACQKRVGGRIVFHDARENKQGIKSAPDVRWLIETRDCCLTLAGILDRIPLFAKKAKDYALWRRALDLWVNTPKGSRWHGPRDVTEMAHLHRELQAVKRWDGSEIDLNFDPFMPPAQAFHYEWARAVYRVLKPGAHLLAFGGTRTFHRMACAIEDAGFEIRDCVQWLYGSGFPKSHDVSKGIDKRGGVSVNWFGPWLRKWRDERGVTQKQVAALFPSKTGGLTGCVANWELGFNLPTNDQFNLICATFGFPFASMAEAEREILETRFDGGGRNVAILGTEPQDYDVTAPATDAARQWEGWGTALKPAAEMICLARKPLSEKTIAANVLRWGTGAINVDGCRVDYESDGDSASNPMVRRQRGCKTLAGNGTGFWGQSSGQPEIGNAKGRWPANVILEDSEEVVGAFPDLASRSTASLDGKPHGTTFGGGKMSDDITGTWYGDSGSAARFFFQAKPDFLCGLCYLPYDATCDANNAVNGSQTGSTLTGASVRNDVPDSQAPESADNPSRLHDNAINVESGSPQCHPLNGSFARPNAQDLLLSRIVQNVKSAASLCDLCATSIARALAALRTHRCGESIQFKDFIDGRNAPILIHHLALYVAGRESTDIILTIPSLKQFFGSVLHAIANSMLASADEPKESNEKSKRFWYGSKADFDDRLGSRHPTIKPLDLMQYLVRLITPTGGVVLDPFAGTGTTGEAAWREGMSAVLIEAELEYQADIRRRMALALSGPDERERESIKARNLPRDDGPLFAWPPAPLPFCSHWPGCGCGTQSGPHTCEGRA